MPGGDRTGPAGMGPMTGRGAGYCEGYSVPVYGRRGFGGWDQSYGSGRGGGWRHRNWFHATGIPGWQRGFRGWRDFPDTPLPPDAPTKQQQLEALKGQAEYLEEALVNIKEQIQDLQSEESSGDH